MFKALRDKLKSWISKSKTETEEEAIETPTDDVKQEVSKKEEVKKPEKKVEKKPEKKAEKKPEEKKEEPKKSEKKEESKTESKPESEPKPKEEKPKEKEPEPQVEEKVEKEREEIPEIEEKGSDETFVKEKKGSVIEDQLESKTKNDYPHIEGEEKPKEEQVSEPEAQEVVAEKDEVQEPKIEEKDADEEVQKEVEQEVEVSEEEEKPKEEKKPGFFRSLFGRKKEEPKEEEKTEPVAEPDEIEEEKPKEEAREEVVEEALEEPVPELEEEKKPQKDKKKSSGFSLFRRRALTEEKFDELFEELELILLQNNVAYEAIEQIKNSLKGKLVGESSTTDIATALSEAISELLINPPSLVEQIKEKEDKPFVILFAGINGAGKTTTIAKVAHMLKKEGFSMCLASADTFRAAAIEQLQVHADRLEVPLVKKDYGADPASVGFDAVKYAQKHNLDVVLIDTAGRMNNRDSLMKEIEKISRVNNPDLKIFLGESTTGNDATNQAKDFNDAIGIDGVILSKADVDEKGGTAISVAQVTQKPIYFLGVGQTYDDLEVFDKDKLLAKIFGE